MCLSCTLSLTRWKWGPIVQSENFCQPCSDFGCHGCKKFCSPGEHYRCWCTGLTSNKYCSYFLGCRWHLLHVCPCWALEYLIASYFSESRLFHVSLFQLVKFFKMFFKKPSAPELNQRPGFVSPVVQLGVNLTFFILLSPVWLSWIHPQF